MDDSPRSGYEDSRFPGDWYQVVRVLGGALLIFCLAVASLALFRGAALERYLGPLAVTVGGFAVLAGLTVAGWRFLDRL